jgi:2'-hydroxyisoflavone reductase
MKILILGGTRFLGRHVAQQALAAGHQVTLLHRGRSNAALFPQAEHRIADRDGDLAALDGGSWDSVIDTSAYVPRQVRAVAARLAGRVGQYQMVSTISVYAVFVPGADESAALATLADPSVETVTGETYGGLKVLCERAAQQGFAGRCLLPRPGLIVGPHDPTGRFTWWLQRFARAEPGSEVLAPGQPDAPVQFIDARDLAAWMLRQAERGGTGVFNVTGPATPLTIGEWLDTTRTALAPAARLTWVDEDFLLAQGVAPWSDLPVWLPSRDEGLHRVAITRALAAGLHCRPLRETIIDTAAWAAGAPPPASGDGPARPAVGLAPEREAALLAAWRARPA